MPTTFEALAVVVIALLPGALFLFSSEQQAGRAASDDRLLTFFAVSVVWHVLVAPFTWWVARLIAGIDDLAAAPTPWALWPALAAYVTIPLLVGAAAGRVVARGGRLPHILPGPASDPAAWDAVFSQAAAHSAWVRVRLKDTGAGAGGWVYGFYGPGRAGVSPDAFASGHPRPADLFLSMTYDCDGAGRPLLDADGRLRERGYGLLVRWDEVVCLEVRLAPVAAATGEQEMTDA